MLHKTITTAQGIIHYWIAGRGEQTIVFTHGAAADHGLFQYQIDYFMHHFTVITWDVHCHGLSRPYDRFSLTQAASELIAILDAEAREQAHLVGQSMGGYISQIVAATYPERVQTVTVIDSSPTQLRYYSLLDRLALTMSPLTLGFYPYPFVAQLMAARLTQSSAARLYMLQTLRTYQKAELIFILTSVYSQLFQSDYAQLSCPLLIMYGDSDTVGNVVGYSRRWAKQEQRPLKIISRAGHNANMDNPDECNELLHIFFKAEGFVQPEPAAMSTSTLH
jgi:pimeloyl-ACP methyl ester carboxylesterase